MLVYPSLYPMCMLFSFSLTCLHRVILTLSGLPRSGPRRSGVPRQVSAFRALQEWLHPGPDVQARPESEYGTLVMTRPELSKRGAFFVPKVDSPEVCIGFLSPCQCKSSTCHPPRPVLLAMPHPIPINSFSVCCDSLSLRNRQAAASCTAIPDQQRGGKSIPFFHFFHLNPRRGPHRAVGRRPFFRDSERYTALPPA